MSELTPTPEAVLEQARKCREHAERLLKYMNYLVELAEKSAPKPEMRRFVLHNNLPAENAVLIDDVLFPSGMAVIEPSGGPAWIHTHSSIDALIAYMNQFGSHCWDVEWIDREKSS